MSLGGTIADLRHYIVSAGGSVAGVATIGASNEASLWLPPMKDTIHELERIGRDELEGVLQEYGIACKLEDLTNAEAGAILKLAHWLEGRQRDILLGIRTRFDEAVERENAKTS